MKTKRDVKVQVVGCIPYYNISLKAHKMPIFGCKAWLWILPDSDDDDCLRYAVQSYNTIVAYIHVSKQGDYLFVDDVLRAVYGYTATSAQHIDKAIKLVDQLVGGRERQHITRYWYKA